MYTKQSEPVSINVSKMDRVEYPLSTGGVGLNNMQLPDVRDFPQCEFLCPGPVPVIKGTG